MRLETGHVPVLKPGDHTAGVDGDSINMGKFAHCTFLVNSATVTGNPVITLYSGATAGTKTTRIVGKYRLGTAVQGSAGADLFGVETVIGTVNTGLVFTGATYLNALTLMEVDATQLAADEPWLTFNIEKGTSSAANLAVTAELLAPRYIGSNTPTAIT